MTDAEQWERLTDEIAELEETIQLERDLSHQRWLELERLKSMASERRNITEPDDWWEAFETQAKIDGQSLSEWAGDCMRANLPKDVSAGLSDRRSVGAPKRPKTEGN